ATGEGLFEIGDGRGGTARAGRELIEHPLESLDGVRLVGVQREGGPGEVPGELVDLGDAPGIAGRITGELELEVGDSLRPDPVLETGGARRPLVAARRPQRIAHAERVLDGQVGAPRPEVVPGV